MSDLIDRQAAIDVGRDLLIPMDEYHMYNQAINNYCAELINLPAAQPEPKWIPCSERLPKYGKNVLITNDKGNVSYGRFRGVEFWKEDGDGYWTWKKNTIEHVLAWMPLPEPWGAKK